jgi:hypothetical protein
MNDLQRYACVVAVYLNTRGFAFVVFESSLSPIDWGIKETRGPQKNSRSIKKTEHHAGGYSRLVCLYSTPLAAGDGVEFCVCQNAIG